MKNQLTRLFKEEEGQAMTEYGLLIGLIAIAVVAVLVVLGPQLAALFQSISDELPDAP
ncbi:Flp family type IVb pilin [Virgibacillus phasianinus]|uniref:Flp family type IVb pilin n=1 Tax=Virgibacillus phasianinus TaxID=2017483 RepID=A0A220U0Q6_9BACI|nr:Flp family type IVb pilin [Virgibacillus phasianinus]ASK61824.1 Flp family type IVb pilin [Virgibacillus phasianinus]